MNDLVLAPKEQHVWETVAYASSKAEHLIPLRTPARTCLGGMSAYDVWKATGGTQTVSCFPSVDCAASQTAEIRIVVLDNPLTAFAIERFGSLRIDIGEGTSFPSEYSVVVAGWPRLAAMFACHATLVAQRFDADVGSRLAKAAPRIATFAPVPASPAARALTKIKQASDLTTEALAPLVGVSRRTLHLWLAGGPISQRNEERLRELEEAISTIATATGSSCRERLMERIPGVPRVYDLLAEGRYDAAIARVTDASPKLRPAVYSEVHPPATSLVAQLSVQEHKSLPLDGRIDRRFTKRLKLKR
jgi:hypothetical protein